MSWDICIPKGFKGTCQETTHYYPFSCEAAKNTLTGFAFQEQNSIAQAMIIIPIALGALCCLATGIQTLTAEESRNKLPKAIASIIPKTDESAGVYLHRIIPLATAILGSSIAASAAIKLLPSSIAIGGAAIGVVAPLSLYMRGSEWINEISSYKKDIIELCREWFSPKDNSALEIGRAIRNIGRVLVGLAVTGVSIWWMTDLPKIIENSSTYDMALPGQVPGFVFLEYFLFTAAHLDQSFTYFMNSSKEGKSPLLNGQTWFHALSAGLTATLPFLYLHADLRIHHTLLASAFMLLPFHNLKFLGLALMADGLNYRANNSGFISYDCNTQGTHFNEIFNPFGVDNVAVNNFASLFSYTAFGCCLEQMAINIQKAIDSYNPRPNPLHELEEPLEVDRV
jgi:hypothetical protein